MSASHAGTQHPLKRQTFRTSRLLDFCSERELVKQIGHPADKWPVVILKELADNAIDGTEESGAAPEIHVEVRGNDISITDNGPGIPAETIAGIVDFSVRVSSREDDRSIPRSSAADSDINVPPIS